MDCGCDGPEFEDEDVNEDEEESVREREILNRLDREGKEANDANLGKGKGNCRSGGRAAPQTDRMANDMEKGKGKSQAKEKAKGKEKGNGNGEGQMQ